MAAMLAYRTEMIGLSERDRTLLRSLLAATQARTGVRWDGDASQPVVYFIDLDTTAGAEFWRSLGAVERREATIALSATPQDEAVRCLLKPLRSASLLSALAAMPLRIAAAPQTQPLTPAAPPRVEPATGPLHLLDILDGPGYPTAQALQTPHWPDLVLGSGNSHAMRTADMDSYIYGFAISLEVTRVGKYAGGPLDDELRMDLDTLRWLALLYAPLDEIAARLPNPPGRLKLTSLPAFGQLPHTLQHVRMAAWLMQHPASTQELANLIGIDADGVRRFLGACNVFGLLRDVVETASEPKPALAAEPEAPQVVAEAAVEATPGVDTAPAIEAAIDEAPGPPTPPLGEGLSVLERLRASREQNRARVAAAIRSVSSN